MKKIIPFIRSMFVIHKILYHHGSKEKLIENLKKINFDNDSICAIEIDKDKYCLVPDASFGTLQFQLNGAEDGMFAIKIYMKIKVKDEKLQELEFYSFYRPENYFFLALFSFLTFGFYMAGAEERGFFVLSILFPVFIAWFNYIYKLQENALIEMSKERLKLSKKEFLPKRPKLKTRNPM